MYTAEHGEYMGVKVIIKHSEQTKDRERRVYTRQIFIGHNQNSTGSDGLDKAKM